MRRLSTVAVAFVLPGLSFGLNNGLGKTPSMGWNPYNAFSCNSNEGQIRANAKKLNDLGLSNAGYNFVGVDCGWQGKQRDSSGGFTWDTTRFPSGIPALGTYIHGLGLKFSIYSDAGYFSCDDQGGNAKWLGSRDFEEQDAKTFAQWGADYLKYDNCFATSPTEIVNYNPPFDVKPRFVRMRDALNATGRPIVYAACNWGIQDPARTWPGTTIANSWRMSQDIGPPAQWSGIFRIINQVVPITGFAGPGGFNDLDMLYVGNNGLTAAEQQTHFSFWAASKSPLMIGFDMSNTGINDNAVNILKNPRVLAVNQDSLGKPISFKRRYYNDQDVWAGPLSDGSTVVLVMNLQTASRSVTFNLADVGFASANAQDLISGNSLGKLTTSYTATLAGHGSLLLKLSSPTTVSAPQFTWYQASSGSLAGGANTRNVNGSTIVGNVGQGGTLTLSNVDGGSSGGTKLLAIDYINADWTMALPPCPNCREALFSVNGGAPVQGQMPLSGQSWDIILQGFLISLPGFKPGKTNTIVISNPSAWTPDFYRIGVRV
ncbi:hypothetical protein AAF712_003862 [Marasmius tenuissimus]|uniref:Alpha-galactosidase n=1 Tax=Marasmius tenuissimus TaxID=585030 RepID=A0ABR3A895_9AGAR